MALYNPQVMTNQLRHNIERAMSNWKPMTVAVFMAHTRLVSEKAPHHMFAPDTYQLLDIPNFLFKEMVNYISHSEAKLQDTIHSIEVVQIHDSMNMQINISNQPTAMNFKGRLETQDTPVVKPKGRRIDLG